MLNLIEMAFAMLKAKVKGRLSERMAEVLDRQAAAATGLTLTTYRQNILENIFRMARHSHMKNAAIGIYTFFSTCRHVLHTMHRQTFSCDVTNF